MYPCEIKQQPLQHTLAIRFHAPVQDLRAHFARVYGAILQYLDELGEPCEGAAFATSYNMDMQNLDIEAGFPVGRVLPPTEEIQAGEIPAGMYAVCHYTGPYDQVGPAYEELRKFVIEQAYEPTGIAYEWYLNGPEVPPEEYKTDIAFSIMQIEEKV